MKAGIKRTIAMALLLSGVSLPAYADLDDLRAAAEKGDAVRQLELGELYEFGFHMPENMVPALTWYMLAAEQGNAKAAMRRDHLKSTLTANQVAEAEREAARLRPKVIPATPPATPTAPPPAEATPVNLPPVEMPPPSDPSVASPPTGDVVTAPDAMPVSVPIEQEPPK